MATTIEPRLKDPGSGYASLESISGIVWHARQMYGEYGYTAGILAANPFVAYGVIRHTDGSRVLVKSDRYGNAATVQPADYPEWATLPD